jgi:Tol biopolymer transport system component
MRNPCCYDRDPSSSSEGSTTRAPRVAVLTRPIAAACFAALALSACGEAAHDATGLERDVGVPSAAPPTGPADAAVHAIVSDPVQPSDAGAASSPARPSSVSGGAIVYVSLPPGSLPEGTEIVVSNLTGSFQAAISIVDGGFDPFPVPASAGDTLDFEVLRGPTPITDWREIVPASRPPVVVRTSPPRGKRDVPVALSILVVFSEPIDAGSLTPASVQVLLDGVPVAGAVGFADEAHLLATFTPAAPLAPDVEYTLRVTQDIEDLTGDALQAAVSVTFATEAATPEPEADPGLTPGYYIYLADPSGVDLRQFARGFEPTWSPDGSKIAFQGMDSGIFVMDVGGTAQRRLRGGDSWLPRWSPEGSKIAFVTCTPNGENGPFSGCDMTFGIINADGSGELMLGQTDFMGTIPPAAWSPDGNKIAFVSGDEECCADLYVINADGSGLAQLTRLGTVTGADWSPDGRTLALRAAGSVYVVNADGSDLIQLTNDTGPLVVRHLEWSPQGDRIAFSLSLDPVVWETEDGGSLTIHVINADGTNRITVATNAVTPRWLRDGRTLYFSRWFVDEIWTVSADGGEPSLLLPDGFGAEWSPDGTRIAYVRHHR